MGVPGAKAASAILLVLLLLPASAREVRLDVPAVTAEGAGILVRMTVSVAPGGGRVEVGPPEALGPGTLASAREAVAAVDERSEADLSNLTISFSFEPGNVVVEGPSAGAAMAAAIIAALGGWEPAAGVYVTGTLGPNATLGPVGSILPKAKAVAAAGGRLLVIPAGQALQTERVRTAGGGEVEVSIDLRSYAAQQWDLAVAEASDLDEVVAHLNGTAPGGAPGHPPVPEVPLSLSFADPLRDVALHLALMAEARLSALAPVLPPSIGTEPLAPRVEAIRNVTRSATGSVAAGSSYIGANDAFRALVDADLLGRLAAYHASADPAALIGGWRLDAGDELERARAAIPLDLADDGGALEWVLSAQLRYGWAAASLDTAGDEPLAAAHAASAAHAWSVVVRDLAAIARARRTGVAVGRDNATVRAAARRLQGRLLSEVALGHALEADLRGAEAHLVSSSRLAEEGWDLASLVDAAQGLARIESAGANRTLADAEIRRLSSSLDGAKGGNLTVIWGAALLRAAEDTADARDAYLHARTGRLMVVIARSSSEGREPPADLLPPTPVLPDEFHRRAWGRFEERIENATALPPLDPGTWEDWGRGFALVALVAVVLLAVARSGRAAGAARPSAPSPADIAEARRRAQAAAEGALERCRSEGLLDGAAHASLRRELAGGRGDRGRD